MNNALMQRNRLKASLPASAVGGIFHAPAALNDAAPQDERRGSDVWKRYAWAFAGVLAATLVYLPLEPIMAKGHDPSILFLPIVIACAVRLGFGPAILASVLGFLSWDYIFIPPRFSLVVTTPQDFLALGVYLLAGITTAQLAAQARRKTEESEARGREITTLYRIGQIVSGESDPDRMIDTLAQQIAQVCLSDRCVISRVESDGQLRTAAIADAVSDTADAVSDTADAVSDTADAVDNSAQCIDALLATARTVLTGSDGGLSDANRDAFLPLRLRGTPIGVLYVAPPADRAWSPRELRTIDALAGYATAVIARQNFTEQAQERIQHAAVTEERNRLTREIHDTVAQSLTGIVILLQAADGAEPDEQATVIAQAGHLAQDCLAEARRSVRAMRPGALEGRDLPTALRDMADRTGRNGGLRTTFQIVGVPVSLPKDSEANLFRIGQEALTNALRHARGATEIGLTLTYEPECVSLRVEDDGGGIDPNRRGAAGFGMTSMRERAAQMNAILTVGPSEDGVGTMVAVDAPLVAASSANAAPDSIPAVIPDADFDKEVK